MFENWNSNEIYRLERLRDRLALRRRMLEQQAINSDPDTFDYWADQLEACNDALKQIFVSLLKAKGI